MILKFEQFVNEELENKVKTHNSDKITMTDFIIKKTDPNGIVREGFIDNIQVRVSCKSEIKQFLKETVSNYNDIVKINFNYEDEFSYFDIIIKDGSVLDFANKSDINMSKYALKIFTESNNNSDIIIRKDFIKSIIFPAMINTSSSETIGGSCKVIDITKENVDKLRINTEIIRIENCPPNVYYALSNKYLTSKVYDITNNV